MNTTIPGQTTPTLDEILLPITNEQDDDLSPFEFNDSPEKDFSPDPGDLLDITDFFKADVTVMKLIYLQDRMDEINDLYHKELDHLNRWKEQRTAILQRQYNFFNRSLENWLAVSNRKSANLPHGNLIFRKQPPHVDILNEDTVLKTGLFVRIKRLPDMAAILKHYKATGEIPDGCDIIEPEPKFSIKLTPGKEHANVRAQDPNH
ncbi:MAG: host-nuclease inhibitor Gam family protein [Candidatus Marinimicrobia bacterium]|nr:host-nuclease inhibitor Gam family protein [Candidatus Neomarinimicrobiota bacterium]